MWPDLSESTALNQFHNLGAFSIRNPPHNLSPRTEDRHQEEVPEEAQSHQVRRSRHRTPEGRQEEVRTVRR